MSAIARLFMLIVMASFCFAAKAQTIVPKLDQQGRKGDVAREAKEKAEARFKEIDTNGDDKLSREEVAHLNYLSQNFDRLDKNQDGFLNWEEYVGHNRWSR